MPAGSLQPSANCAAGTLLFSLEESGCETDDAQTSSLLRRHLGVVLSRVQACSSGSSLCPLARQLTKDAQQVLKSGVEHSIVELGQVLAGMGYQCVLREALAPAAGGSNECFRSLRHTFLVVQGSGECEGMELIVEKNLRQHFAIPHATPEFAQVLDAVPDLFVGPSSRLFPLVQLLCAVMADSFEQQGLPLPPWRRENAVASKWAPSASRQRDTPLAPATPLTPPAAALAGLLAVPLACVTPAAGPLEADGEEQGEEEHCAPFTFDDDLSLSAMSSAFSSRCSTYNGQVDCSAGTSPEALLTLLDAQSCAPCCPAPAVAVAAAGEQAPRQHQRLELWSAPPAAEACTIRRIWGFVCPDGPAESAVELLPALLEPLQHVVQQQAQLAPQVGAMAAAAASPWGGSACWAVMAGSASACTPACPPAAPAARARSTSLLGTTPSSNVDGPDSSSALIDARSAGLLSARLRKPSAPSAQLQAAAAAGAAAAAPCGVAAVQQGAGEVQTKPPRYPGEMRIHTVRVRPTL